MGKNLWPSDWSDLTGPHIIHKGPSPGMMDTIHVIANVSSILQRLTLA